MHYPDFSSTHEKTWHANGRQASLTAPHGTTYSFSWDEVDRLQSVVIPGEGVIAYSEYQWHQPTRIEFPGGTVREDSYDGLQRHTGIRVTNAADQTLMDYAYTWNETGNITEKATEHGPYQYGYDPIDRLIEAEYPTFSAEEWTYDPLGNRITDASTGEQEWQYNDNNELLSSVEYTYAYDENGSLIAEYHPDGTLYRGHEYNAETRLSAVRDGQGELMAEYTYDPFGRRVSKTVYDPPGANPETTWYFYSDQGLMAELDETGNPLDFYLFPPDGLWSTDPILRRSEGSYYYYQTDHLGTPQQLIDRSGNLVHSREMRAFGEVAQSGMEDRWRFPGQLESGETGLYYNYFRDYEPGTGRYVQSDPIGLRGGVNVFVYGHMSPTFYTDPLGLYNPERGHPDFEHPGYPWTDHEEDDFSACEYYSDVHEKVGCRYHSFAYDTCTGTGFNRSSFRSRGATPFLRACNLALNRSRVRANDRNCIRRCLVREDQKARNDPECRTGPGSCPMEEGCTLTRCIDSYHDQCFEECGMNPRCYGGNYFSYPNDDGR
ncbi:RHS domain-containing protein [Wenzhouxiangella sp. AB-CW3]|uniref:RHS repeat domain-containing protein n=1 Tax=Wenzhouxiangella sp. AB-CW3 TaxID=2771012 RepID=UPI00168A8C5D|nr:RHS repeat-associated core domain-containing protein [Wenzhouxiangella sp. AB-CW3]QOC21583.1 RHS domain-containing protein [Wenzhouxiangella sp. AB-CW3]